MVTKNEKPKEIIVCRICGNVLNTECERKYHLCDDDLTLISEMSQMLKPFISSRKGD